MRRGAIAIATPFIGGDWKTGDKASINPMINPPNIAPGNEPIPPSTAAVKALIPAINSKKEKPLVFARRK